MPIALRGPRKAMRGKCERGRGSANADGGSVNAGAEVQTRTGRVRKSSRAMGTRRRRLSAPWPRFHGADRPDVYIIIHVRACCCGECALNPPTSQPIPSRRPSLAPAQRHALAEHFRSPTQPRRTPAGCATHSPPTSPPIPRRRPPLAPAQRHALAEHFRPPRSADARPRSPEPRPQAVRCTPADRTTHSPHSAALPLLPFRFGHKKTAPHSACAMPNVSVDRRCGRSFGLVSRALFAAVAGRWRVGVGLRPQPWALRSRRCGRVLRA